MQPGPIYFLTPRKCSLFGICCEAIPRQVNYLCDESVDTGKGANAVVSQLHHFFATHGLGEEHVYLHADNCTGQNKNNTMLRYFVWRVMAGLHKSITLSFLIAGHTKFSPDWCFGLVKRLYRRSKVDCLDDIVQVVSKSANCNTPQLIGSQQGDVIVPMYDWTKFLDPLFTTLKHIKRYHHFCVSQEHPGTVFCKEFADSEEIEVVILRDSWQPSPAMLPPLIHPSGLSNERQWYLFEKIRPFCSLECQDIACPRPARAKNTGSQSKSKRSRQEE